jgi:hypothetical protein
MPMNTHDDHEHAEHEMKNSWLDRWWFLLVILFGVICVLALDFWHPVPSV